MALQTDNLTIVDAGRQRTLSSVDTLRTTGSREIGGDLLVEGNLVVEGTTTAIETENLKVVDNHILLNDGYTTTVAQTGGLVTNYLPTATTDTVATGGFTAGVVATSNPTIDTTGAATFAATDIVLITNAANDGNNILAEVSSHAANVLTIKGIGTVATVEDFTDNQLITDTTVQGTITKVNVSVLRAGTDGVWETGAGNQTGISFSDLGSGAGNSLNAAYVVGNTITTSAGEGDVIVAGTEKLQVTSTAGLDVDTVADFDVSTFDVLMSGTNGFSIDGTAASNVTADAGDLTLATTTSGTLILSAVAAATLDATTFSIDGTVASNVSTTGANLTLSTLTSGSLILSGVALVDIDAGANLDIDVTGTFDMLSTGVFSIDGTGASNVSATSGNLTLSTLTSGDLILSSIANVTIDGTGVSIDGTSASNLSTTGANLTLSTLSSGSLIVNAVALLDIDAGANMDVDVTGTYDLLATGAGSLDFTGASNLSVTSGDLTLSTLTSGSLNLTSFGASTYTVPNANAAAWLLTDGTDNYLRVDSVDNSLEVLAPFVDVAPTSGLGWTATTDSALVAGNLLYVKATTGNVDLADADNGSLRVASVVGVSQGVFSGAGTAQVFSYVGQQVPVLFGSAPAAADNGKRVYLSTTAGQATLTAPSGATTTQFMIGILIGGDGADTTPEVIWMPDFVAAGASVTDP
jgi:hypothetical protein